ncbi:MAG TPA: peptidyl-alpha-hydroxyglycine alpha-amidating lyase family protein [Chitinophagaceae bacterium]|nr:peptidyl-alpha-hydroxyglycine alpha-amidating lyase family protein [Chitinophagaceae bacterium]
MDKTRALLLIGALLLFSCKLATKQNNTQLAEYQLVPNWPALPAGYPLSQVTGVGIDKAQNVFLFHRTGRKWTEPFPDSMISVNTILMMDRQTGKMLNSWGANQFVMPHGLTVDKDDNVWVTDVALHQVFKFTHEGQLLMTLGQARQAGTDSLHFNLPTDVAVASDGSLYVSDGYGNSRVVKFSPSGKYLFAWGTKGDQPGQFKTPHGIDLDAAGNVYVADRENNRIQKFDADGKFINSWKNDLAEQLYSLTVDKSHNQVFAADYLTQLKLKPLGSDIIHLDTSLHFFSRFGRSGQYEGPISRYHDIAIDNEGNIYAGDILNNTIQKFSKR